MLRLFSWNGLKLPAVLLSGLATNCGSESLADDETAPEADERSTENGTSTSPIIGGSAVSSTGIHPWQVKLVTPLSSRCAASIIHPEWVLTAGHCVFGVNAGDLRLQAGILQWNSTGGQHRSVSQVIVHERYRNTDPAAFDIALLRVSTPWTFDASVRPVAIARHRNLLVNSPFGSDTLTVAGWGATVTGSRIGTNALRAVELPLADPQMCRSLESGDSFDQSTMLCTGAPGLSECAGDSGGPVVDPGTHWRQVGIVSWGDRRCATFSVETDVAAFSGWIESHTGRLPAYGVGNREFTRDVRAPDMLLHRRPLFETTGDIEWWNVAGPFTWSAGTFWGAVNGFSVVGAADFTGDGVADILGKALSTGEVYVLVFDGVNFVPTIFTGMVATGEREPIAVGDSDADGHADIIVRNPSNNAIRAVHTFRGLVFWEGADQFPVGPEWNFGGTADFDLDGGVDWIWHNTWTGRVAIWRMERDTGRHLSSHEFDMVDSRFGLHYLGGIGDYTLDGKVDLAFGTRFLEPNPGPIRVLPMDGLIPGNSFNLDRTPAPTWHVVD